MRMQFISSEDEKRVLLSNLKDFIDGISDFTTNSLHDHISVIRISLISFSSKLPNRHMSSSSPLMLL
jgi:hypothetical protein